MTSIALESLSEAVRAQVLKALREPVLVTDEGKPILVVRNLLEDDVADDLIAQHPAFKASIQRARQQKAEGKVKTLAELRAKYDGRQTRQGCPSHVLIALYAMVRECSTEAAGKMPG